MSLPALQVCGNQIVDSRGNPCVVRGMSLFWSQWMGQYWNPQAVRWLGEDWGCSVIRAAVGIEDADGRSGYLDRPEHHFQMLETVVEAARACGLYVIVDWHDHHASRNVEAAKAFFDRAARRWGHCPEVIWEIYNEPEVDDWETVKRYSEQVIHTIRRHSSNLILAGTPHWSQDVDLAANDPLEDANLAYSLHFYASTHKQNLRDKAQYALDMGLALFASEWGCSEATGNGFLDVAETRKWLDFLDARRISWCNWSVADKLETSAALLPGAPAEGGWAEQWISASGRLVRSELLAQKSAQQIFQQVACA